MKVEVFRVSNDVMKNQCYLIHHQGTGILIDPAWDYELIDGYLSEHKIVLKGVMLTHSHKDHVNLSGKFAREYGVPVYMSAVEVKEYDFSCLNLVKLAHLSKVVVDDFEVIALLTPGHTAGSMCYLINGNCFTGDTIFIEGVGSCSETDVDDLYDSVQYLKKQLSKDTLIWPGHCFGMAPGMNMDYLLSNNLYFQLDEKDLFRNFRMRKNRPDPLVFQ